MRRDVRWTDGRDDDTTIRYARSVSSVSAHNSDDGGTNRSGVVQSGHKVWAHLRVDAPPPTESTRTRSSERNRLPLSHDSNTVAQPSSFVRAVSSDTLSVGA